MIRGTVTPQHEAVVPLRIRGSGGNELDVDAIIDTGFSGFLTLPPALISTMNLPLRSQIDIQLGDGTVRAIDTYDLEVEWNGVWIKVVASEIDTTPLLGMSLLARHQMFMEVVPGGVVDVSPIP
jgi:clan AA aspartic protease